MKEYRNLFDMNNVDSSMFSRRKDIANDWEAVKGNYKLWESCGADGGAAGCGDSGAGVGGDGGGGDGGVGGGAPSIPQYFFITSNSGVYSGSLSSQGSMVAMQLNPGGYRYFDAISGVDANPAAPYNGFNPSQPTDIRIKPWLSGYLREYWRDPTTCTFGNTSAIPAITGVMPADFTGMQGNFNYYVDNQIIRLTGANGFDFFHFYSTFNQVLNWVTTSNSYLAGLINVEKNNLKYYGFNSYDDLVTQGFNKYKASAALPKAFTNVGVFAQNIPTGFFGTPNDVAKVMLDYGLGAIGELSQKLYKGGVNFDDIYNAGYTTIISDALVSITNQADLAIIQEVLETTVPRMTSPLDYTTIEGASGLTNDSGFANLAEVGADLFIRAPGANFSVGSEVAALIKSIQNETSAAIEDLGTADSLLTPEIVASLRSFLPLAPGNRPVNMVEVIGMASGYLDPYMSEVNDGLAELLASKWGPVIRQKLTDISRFAAGIPISQAEIDAAASYTPVPAPVTSTDEFGNTTVIQNGGPGYWASRCIRAQEEYYVLLDQVVNDGDDNMVDIVKRINENYFKACELTYYEYVNYNKANLTTTSFADNSMVFSFVTSLPSLAADEQNIGTDYLLYGMSQTNDSGNLLRTIMAQAKNQYFLGNAGVRIKGVV